MPGTQDLADQKLLYLTTVGRKTALPREIEIWFVACRGRFYLFAETGDAANWVRNIRHDPKVAVRISECRIEGVTRARSSGRSRPVGRGRRYRRAQIWLGGRVADRNHSVFRLDREYRGHRRGVNSPPDRAQGHRTTSPVINA